MPISRVRVDLQCPHVIPATLYTVAVTVPSTVTVEAALVEQLPSGVQQEDMAQSLSVPHTLGGYVHLALHTPTPYAGGPRGAPTP
ncbi:hypothetical protein GCM10027075_22840 [Streptomyces heilongjiangensis]